MFFFIIIMRKIFSVPIGILQPSDITDIMYLLCLVFIYPVPAQKGQIRTSKNKGKFIQTIFSPKKLHNL